MDVGIHRFNCFPSNFKNLFSSISAKNIGLFFELAFLPLFDLPYTSNSLPVMHNQSIEKAAEQAKTARNKGQHYHWYWQRSPGRVHGQTVERSSVCFGHKEIEIKREGAGDVSGIRMQYVSALHSVWIADEASGSDVPSRSVVVSNFFPSQPKLQVVLLHKTLHLVKHRLGPAPIVKDYERTSFLNGINLRSL